MIIKTSPPIYILNLMIISLRLKNFYSLRDDSALDFTADMTDRKDRDYLPENLIQYCNDQFVNIIGLFGSNAAGKSNIIKALKFCRNFILTSHLNNEGHNLDYEPFKFDRDKPSEFQIEFVTEGVEYDYSFTLYHGRITEESLYHFPNNRRAKVYKREANGTYSFGKGIISRPADVVANTGPTTLFLSRASSMNRQIAAVVYRFFLNGIMIGISNSDLSSIEREDIEQNKDILLKAFEVSDSDIVDIRFIEEIPGQLKLQSYHKENPLIPFDFQNEESEGTKRLLAILLTLLKRIAYDTTLFIDEFDLKLHLRLAQFILDVVRASHRLQLVFTSHNSALIDTSKFRREQIVFVNKQSDGNTEFLPLSDFVGVDRNTDVEKWYMMGRFDGVPYVGDIYPVINEMLKINEGKKI